MEIEVKKPLKIVKEQLMKKQEEGGSSGDMVAEETTEDKYEECEGDE